MAADHINALVEPPIESQEKIRRSLPPFPAVALQLMSLLDSDVPVKQIVGLLRVDPALCGEILRVSNSALYGLSRQVETISHAVVILGGDTVKRLALTVALGRFSHQFMRHDGLRICWDHSVASAVAAGKLAELLYLSRDAAYTAGLLHDIGRFALLASDPEEYGRYLAAHGSEGGGLDIERSTFGIDHCQVGAWLALEWNLPADVTAVIATHHAGSDARPFMNLVRAADRIACSLGYPSSGEAREAEVEAILADGGFKNPASLRVGLDGLQSDIEKSISAVTPRG